jgi:hypothetical protein
MVARKTCKHFGHPRKPSDFGAHFPYIPIVLHLNRQVTNHVNYFTLLRWYWSEVPSSRASDIIACLCLLRFTEQSEPRQALARYDD